MAGEKPYVSNGITSDPREQVMWDIYVTNLGKGIDNAMQSALEAGYEETTAKNITLTGWYKERKNRLKRKDMLSNSEKKLAKTLEYEVESYDESGKLTIKTDLLKIQVDVAKTLVTTLGKDEGYSTRQEVTGANGERLIASKEERELIDKAFNQI